MGANIVTESGVRGQSGDGWRAGRRPPGGTGGGRRVGQVAISSPRAAGRCHPSDSPPECMISVWPAAGARGRALITRAAGNLAAG